MSLILLSSVLKINMLVLYHGKPYIKMPMWHYIMKSLYKSYPVEYTYCTGCPVHYHHMTATWLPPNCHQTATRLPPDCHMTATWLLHDCRTTATWLPHDCRMTATWLPHDRPWLPHGHHMLTNVEYTYCTGFPVHYHHMTTTWLPRDRHMTATWLPHDHHMLTNVEYSALQVLGSATTNTEVHQMSIPTPQECRCQYPVLMSLNALCDQETSEYWCVCHVPMIVLLCLFPMTTIWQSTILWSMISKCYWALCSCVTVL